MENFLAQILPAINDLLAAIIMCVCGFLANKIRTMINKKENRDETEAVIKHTVQYVEQVYSDLHGQDKFNACLEKIEELLEEKGVPFSKEEIEVLIEAAVNSLNLADSD